MRHIKIYEAFTDAVTPDLDAPAELEKASHLEMESSDFRPTADDEEGEYVITFNNAEGEETTLQVGFANEPEYVGDSMVASMDMVEDSSSDGRAYTVIGYYDEVPNSGGAFELQKVIIEEA